MIAKTSIQMHFLYANVMASSFRNLQNSKDARYQRLPKYRVQIHLAEKREYRVDLAITSALSGLSTGAIFCLTTGSTALDLGNP